MVEVSHLEEEILDMAALGEEKRKKWGREKGSKQTPLEAIGGPSTVSRKGKKKEEEKKGEGQRSQSDLLGPLVLEKVIKLSIQQ